MPKQLITLIGLVVSLAVVTLGVVVIAVPLYLESVSVDAQTATVGSTNDVYQTQVDYLTEESERQNEIDDSVAALHAQIPMRGQLDDVFEVVGNAAAAAGVVIVSVTAGDAIPFVARTGVDDPGAAVESAEPAVPEDVQPEAGTEGVAGASDVEEKPMDGRQQVDFSIAVTATDMNQVAAFLDALRAGPRLFSTITTTSTTTGEGIDVQVDGLAFVNTEG